MTKLANESIGDIDVSNNAFDNQLVAKIKISTNNNENTVAVLKEITPTFVN